MIVRSPRTKTKTPNQNRARIMVEALRNVEGDIALIGTSNQGLFIPLVAAARPIKRVVFINGAIPRPGKSFWETAKKERVFASVPARVLAWLSPGMHEVCPLEELPKVEYVYISAEYDEAVRPEWEQRAAREYLHVEPVVIAGGGHSDIVLDHVSEVVDATTLQPQKQRRESRVPLPRKRSQSAGRGLASFAISHFVPLIVYFAVRPYAANDTNALAAAWFIPLAWTLGSSLRMRRLDIFGLVGISVYGVALSISVFFGAGGPAVETAPCRAGGYGGLGLSFLGRDPPARIHLIRARRVQSHRGGRCADRGGGPHALQDRQDTEIIDVHHRHRLSGRCGFANGACHHAFHGGVPRGEDGNTCRSRTRHHLGRRAVPAISAMMRRAVIGRDGGGPEC